MPSPEWHHFQPTWPRWTWRTATPEPTGNISRLQYDPLRLDVHYLPAPKTAQSILALGVIMAQLLFVSLSMPRLWGRRLKATAKRAAQGVMLLICDNINKSACVRAQEAVCACQTVSVCSHIFQSVFPWHLGEEGKQAMVILLPKSPEQTNGKKKKKHFLVQLFIFKCNIKVRFPFSSSREKVMLVFLKWVKQKGGHSTRGFPY